MSSDWEVTRDPPKKHVKISFRRFAQKKLGNFDKFLAKKVRKMALWPIFGPFRPKLLGLGSRQAKNLHMMIRANLEAKNLAKALKRCPPTGGWSLDIGPRVRWTQGEKNSSQKLKAGFV